MNKGTGSLEENVVLEEWIEGRIIQSCERNSKRLYGVVWSCRKNDHNKNIQQE